MTSRYQIETQSAEENEPIQDPSDTIFTVIGLFLVMVLVWVTIKGKLRDWLMK
ncbi:MAG: hypothetical protein RIF46_02220 [Cyclobacteriaceae bacterium]